MSREPRVESSAGSGEKRATTRRGDVRRAFCGAALGVLVCAGWVQAQPSSINKAVELENAGKWREAIAVWRSVLGSGDVVQGILGLERVFSQLQQDDSTIAIVDTLIPKMRSSRVVRGVQFRVLRSMGRERDVQAAFEDWVVAAPKDPAPYKDYAAQLILDGRAPQADTVLKRAGDVLGSTKELLIEVAQLRVALGRWGSGAEAWRQAMQAEQYMEQSAQYSLGQAPASMRDSVRAALAVVPVPASSRKVLGQLELQWGNPREGWRVLSLLTIADSAYDTWNDFAAEAERQGSWIPARDALLQMNAARPAPGLLVRAAGAAVSGGEPASALATMALVRPKLDAAAARKDLLPLEIRALTQLGRAAEAEGALAREGDKIDAGTKRIYQRQIAWGWVRAGDVERARTALSGASSDDDEEVNGWIALFDGDFAKARAGLRRPADATGDVVTAMALLGRTRADSSRTVGSAFLTLARGDTSGAAQRFERAADELSDAAPLLLAFAARLRIARRQDAAAIALWQRIVLRHPLSPEAAESDLEWARTLRRRGDSNGAIERLEHLILSYPQSALVPQARRELEALRTGAATA